MLQLQSSDVMVTLDHIDRWVMSRKLRKAVVS